MFQFGVLSGTRVSAWNVIGLEIVFDEHLPVACKIILLTAGTYKIRHPIVAYVFDHVAQRCSKRFALRIEIDEYMPFPGLHLQGNQSMLRGVEALDLVHAGCADQFSV